MLNKLYELNPFFEISVNNITVLCNLDNAFAFRCSDIMNEWHGFNVYGVWNSTYVEK